MEEEAAGPQKVWGGGEGQLPQPPKPNPLTAQQLHTEGDPIVPGYGQDAHKASQEGGLKHVLLVGVIVQVAWEDLAAERVSGGPLSRPTHPDSQA